MGTLANLREFSTYVGDQLDGCTAVRSHASLEGAFRDMRSAFESRDWKVDDLGREFRIRTLALFESSPPRIGGGLNDYDRFLGILYNIGVTSQALASFLMYCQQSEKIDVNSPSDLYCRQITSELTVGEMVLRSIWLTGNRTAKDLNALFGYHCDASMSEREYYRSIKFKNRTAEIAYTPNDYQNASGFFAGRIDSYPPKVAGGGNQATQSPMQIGRKFITVNRKSFGTSEAPFSELVLARFGITKTDWLRPKAIAGLACRLGALSKNHALRLALQ